MKTVLYIKANPKSDQDSRTFQISEHFMVAYRALHPGDKVVTLDLYQEKIKPLSGEDVASVHNHTGKSDSNHPILKYALQFQGADKYVIAAPMWNLGSPAILKAYMDYVTIAGINFCYTETGPTGLCQGRKAIHITTRGGAYSEGAFAAYEMGDRYLRTILGFFGVVDFTTIVAEKLDIQGENVELIMKNALNIAAEKAKTF